MSLFTPSPNGQIWHVYVCRNNFEDGKQKLPGILHSDRLLLAFGTLNQTLAKAINGGFDLLKTIIVQTVTEKLYGERLSAINISLSNKDKFVGIKHSTCIFDNFYVD